MLKWARLPLLLFTFCRQFSLFFSNVATLCYFWHKNLSKIKINRQLKKTRKVHCDDHIRRYHGTWGSQTTTIGRKDPRILFLNQILRKKLQTLYLLPVNIVNTKKHKTKQKKTEKSFKWNDAESQNPHQTLVIINIAKPMLCHSPQCYHCLFCLFH